MTITNQGQVKNLLALMSCNGFEENDLLESGESYQFVLTNLYNISTVEKE